MSKSGQPPDLKKYMDKKLNIKLNANRVVVGTLRGYDQFMNLVLDGTVEINGNERNEIGMVAWSIGVACFTIFGIESTFRIICYNDHRCNLELCYLWLNHEYLMLSSLKIHGT
ncbi:hypothetical protein KP509_05G102600 [Ceratopteris richardii]|uniref:Small nuclear ribonucleoprotein G n=1 Tax=Ceratopteris richardii TaxID=49495 RepID=A0A8T2UPE2_CERRI|nr:hypothetical protein KP509_05G102600 [Ceratopteris richardii]